MRAGGRHPSSAIGIALLLLSVGSSGLAAQETGQPTCVPAEEEREVLQGFDLVPRQIGVRFSTPLAAAQLAKTVSGAAWANGICAGDTTTKVELEYKSAVGTNHVARFEAAADCDPEELALLARAIVDNVREVTAAGLVVERRPSGRVEILTDELTVESAQDLDEALFADGDVSYGEYPLRARDPFVRNRCTHHRLYRRSCVRDLTSAACRKCVYDCRDAGGSHCLALCASTHECLRDDCEVKDLIASLAAARANDGDSVTPRLIPLVLSEEEKKFDAWLEKQTTAEKEVTGSIGVSFTGNETRGESDFKLGTDIKLNRGSYPGQLRVGAGAQVEFKNRTVEEDVTKLEVSYDYYFERWLELYGFMERFTNSFLSIEQRYETGAGVLFEWDLKRRRTGNDFCVGVPGPVHYHPGSNDEILVTRAAQKMLDVHDERLRREAREKGEVSEATKKDYCRYKLGIQKRNARFQLGLAFGLIGDFEQPAELTLTAEDAAGEAEGISVKVRPPSAHRFRLSVRPTITFRPNDRFELDAHYYFKPALDEAQVGTDPEKSGELGRQEFLVEAKIALTSADTGGQKVGLTLSAEQFHDRFPPSVSAAAALAGFGVTEPSEVQLTELSFERDGVAYRIPDAGALIARRTHTVYKFSLSVSW